MNIKPSDLDIKTHKSKSTLIYLACVSAAFALYYVTGQDPRLLSGISIVLGILMTLSVVVTILGIIGFMIGFKVDEIDFNDPKELEGVQKLMDGYRDSRRVSNLLSRATTIGIGVFLWMQGLTYTPVVILMFIILVSVLLGMTKHKLGEIKTRLEQEMRDAVDAAATGAKEVFGADDDEVTFHPK